MFNFARTTVYYTQLCVIILGVNGRMVIGGKVAIYMSGINELPH